MKNKISVFLLCVFVSAFIAISCSEKSAVPAPVSNTPTASISATFTITASVTVTSTFTPTPTSTESTVLVANFEGTYCLSSVSCSNCTNSLGGGMTAGISLYSRDCAALTGAPAELGSKAYSISATAANNTSDWFSFYIQTYSAMGTGSDFSVHNRLNFNYKVTTDAAVSDNILLNLALIADTMADQMGATGIVLDKSGNWASLSLDIGTFTVGSATLTADEIMSQIANVSFYFLVGGDGSGSAFTEIIVDNVTLTVE